MSGRLARIIAGYRTVLNWNGESAKELAEAIKRVREAAPGMLSKPLPWIMQHYRYGRDMRYDTSRLHDPVLAIDKNGCALIGTRERLSTEQLMKIVFPEVEPYNASTSSASNAVRVCRSLKRA